MKKNVFYFGNKKSDGSGKMKDVLGGKGAGLAEMTEIGINVPPGFTISTNVCGIFYKNKKRNIVGIHFKPEFPKNPHIIIENDFTKSTNKLSSELFKKIIRKVGK